MRGLPLLLLLLLPLASAQDAALVIDEDTVLEAPCGGEAVLESLTAITVSAHIMVVHDSCEIDPSAETAPHGADLVLRAPTVIVEGTLQAADAPAAALRETFMGQHGGRGGNVVIDSQTYRIEGTIAVGRGGDGGWASVTNLSTIEIVQGGDGGPSGDILTSGVTSGSSYDLTGGDGGHGGHAYAWGATGSPGERGGMADARGGDGGESLWDGVGGTGGFAYAQGGHGGNGTIPTVDAFHSAGGDGGDAFATGGTGGAPDGAGGQAWAFGGTGGNGGSSVVAPCTSSSYAAVGGDGGDARARGGVPDGQNLFAYEFHAAALAMGGNGGNGGDATGKRGVGMDGGRGGNAEAVGQDPGQEMSAGRGGHGGDGRIAGGEGGGGGDIDDDRTLGVMNPGRGGDGGWALGEVSCDEAPYAKSPEATQSASGIDGDVRESPLGFLVAVAAILVAFRARPQP